MSISYSVIFNASLSGVAGTVSAGVCVVNTASGFVVGTSANRNGARCTGIALTTSSPAFPVVDVQVSGLIPAAISGLGSGSASWVRVNTSTAVLERVTTPSGSDDVVGWCDANGDVHAEFGLLTPAMTQAIAAPSGTGFAHVTSGAVDAAARAVNLATADVTGLLPEANGGLNVSIAGSAQGDILYKGASTWVRLGAGTNGQLLQTQGAGANPQWATVSSSVGGSNTQILFNDGGVENGSAHFTYTKSTGVVSVAADGTGALAIGSTPATAGDLRLYNGAKAEYRDLSNETNYVALMGGDGSVTNELCVGCDTGLSVGVPNMQVRVAASCLIQFGSISYTNMQVDTANECLDIGIAGSAPTGMAANAQLYGLGAGHLSTTDVAGNVGQSQVIVQSLASNYTNGTTGSTNTDHVVAMAANEVWLIEWVFAIGCSSTGGYKVQVSTPSGATVRGYVTGAGNGANTYASASIASINTLFGAPFGTGATIDPMRGWALVTNGSTPGNLQIGVACGSSSQTTTVYAGSSIMASIAVTK